MNRILVHVEGQTEEGFVNQVLAPHLYRCGFTGGGARLMGDSCQRDHRGGIRGWPSTRRTILDDLCEDRSCVATMMVDFFGLPQSGGGDWPGRAKASNRRFPDKAALIEDALTADILREMGQGFDSRRFVPFVMMHEFEALLFSDCTRLSLVIGRSELAPRLQQIRESFESPEEINESPDQAPSKRITRLHPGYRKARYGTLVAQEIGLPGIRAECPHFSSWVSRLEELPAAL